MTEDKEPDELGNFRKFTQLAFSKTRLCTDHAQVFMNLFQATTYAFLK